MAYYPIAIDLTDKPVLVVGGGTVALRKIETLLEFGARVTVVSPELDPEIERLANRITIERRGYESRDTEGAAVAIAATDDSEVNTRVSEDCRAAGILVNVVDVPELCTFIVQSVVRRGDLMISITSGGKSPALAKTVRTKIEEVIGPEYAELAELMGEMRDLAKAMIKSQPERERAFNMMLRSDVPELIRLGKREAARDLAIAIVEEVGKGPPAPIP